MSEHATQDRAATMYVVWEWWSEVDGWRQMSKPLPLDRATYVSGYSAAPYCSVLAVGERPEGDPA